ncbi:MAG: glutathione S-transferase, partial [Paracoccaceae bacterium]|nr:glutathione S-transferase [Paracoccaceae bacterium]
KLLDDLGMAERPSWLSGTQPSILGYYLVVLLRWSALYPSGNTDWFDLTAYPFLQGLTERLERRPAAQRAAKAEGLGPTPFSAPRHATPPEGSAL